MNNPLSKFRTICEVLREINDLCQDESKKDKAIRIKLDEASRMAKSMSRRLEFYNKEFIKEEFKENKDSIKDYKRRKKKGYKMIKESKLEKLANSIPSQGGREIGYYLREKASSVKSGNDIVEVGSWLGAGTAQLCLGILDSKNDVGLHIYDRFKAGKTEVEKAKKQGVKIKSKQDTFPLVKNIIEKFKVRHKFYKISIKSIGKYRGRKIGMYVDDASKRKEYFDHVMETFKPHFIPDETILVLMDYFYFEWKKKDGLDYQFNYMQDNPEFEFIGRIEPDLSAAAFIYRGKK